MYMGDRIIRIFFLIYLINFGACAQGFSKIQIEENKSAPKYFGPHRSVQVNEEKRRIWIQTVLEKVSEAEFTEKIQYISPVIVDIPDFKQVSYRIHEQGKIRFSNGDEIVIKLHSAHENPEVGDVVIAFAKDGKVYINTGHVCGGMVHIIRHSALIPAGKEEFFDQFFSDTDDEKWKISDISRLLKKK